jgi:serine/alanine adding enzyme
MTAVAAAAPEPSRLAVQLVQDGAAWDAYVSRHREASAYHAFGWRDVISNAFGHETRYLAALSSEGILGVLPLVLFRSRIFGRFVVSMPFLNYGGVLADSPEAEEALVAAAVNETRRAGARYLELRHTRQLFPRLQAKRHKVAMEVTLQPSEEAQWQAIDRKVRNQVRKGQKSGLHTVQGGAELLDPFYSVFARNMRDLGTPVYGIGWFREILRAFPEASRLFVVSAGGQPVAGSFVLWHRSTIEVPWASALREFNPQCANVLMYWEMLRFAVERGFRRFDLGRSTPGEGTFQFKRQWGAEPRELVWEYWTADGRSVPNLSPTNPRFSRAIDVWRRLPVPLTKLIGPRVVANIP